MATIDERDRRNASAYTKLYRMAVRMFFMDEEEIAPAIIDYMVLNQKCSMSQDDMKTELKLGEKKIRKVFKTMENEMILFRENRWTLMTNVKEYVQNRIGAIKNHINNSIKQKKTKEFKCPKNCEGMIDIPEMTAIFTYKHICSNCKEKLIVQSSPALNIEKINLLDKILEDVNRCDEKSFPIKQLFPQDYIDKHKVEEVQENTIVALEVRERLHKEVIKKINQKRKSEGIPELPEPAEKVFEKNKPLVDWFKLHPTDLEKKHITQIDVLRKRRLAELQPNNNNSVIGQIEIKFGSGFGNKLIKS